MNELNLIPPSQALNRINSQVIESGKQSIIKDKLIRHGYSIGQYHFLVTTLTQAEVIDETTIYPIPKSQPGLQGLINVRGSLIPVFDIKLLLNLENSKKEHILVLGKDNKAIAILVDSLPTQPSIEDKMLQAPPIHNDIREYVSDTYMDKENNVWLDFDYECFFTDLAKSN